MVCAVMSIGFLVLVHRWILPWTLLEVATRAYAPGVALLATGTGLVVWRVGSAPLPALAFLGALCLTITLMGVLGWCFVLSDEHRQRLLGVVAGRFTRA